MDSSIAYLETKCKAGDRRAFRQLAYRYWSGLGVEADPGRAIDLFKLGDPEDPFVQYHLAMAYQDGDYLERDREKAEALFASCAPKLKALAEAGDPLAQYCLAILYYYGDGFAQDSEAAFSWLRASLAQGFFRACDTYVYLVQEHPECSDPDYLEFAYAHRLLMEDPQGEKAYECGVAFYEGNGVTPDPKGGYELIEDAAKKNNPLALSYLRYHDAPVSKLEEQARPLLEQAQSWNDPLSYVKAGQLFENEAEDEDDLSRAEECFKKAQALADEYGSYYLGLLYASYSEEFPQIPREEIAGLLEKGQSAGYEGADSIVGVFYLDDPAEASQKKAKLCLEKAAEAGDLTALAYLTVYSFSGERPLFFAPEKAIFYGEKFVEKASEEDFAYSEAIDTLAAAYTLRGAEGDDAKSFELLLKNEALGFANSSYQLGVAYRDGVGTAVSLGKAIASFRKGAKEGSFLSRSALKALLLLHPEEQLPEDQSFLREEDENEAVLQELGAALAKNTSDFGGDTGAVLKTLISYPDYQLGANLLAGSSGKRDPEKGLFYLDKAARSGHVFALMTLINYYEGATPNPDNEKKAQEYRLLSGEFGIPGKYLLDAAVVYFIGNAGVPQDLDLAKKTLALAKKELKIVPLALEDGLGGQIQRNYASLLAKPRIFISGLQREWANGDLSSGYGLACLYLGVPEKASAYLGEENGLKKRLDQALRLYYERFSSPELSPAEREKGFHEATLVHEGLLRLEKTIASQTKTLRKQLVPELDYSSLLAPSKGEALLKEVAEKGFGPALFLYAEKASEKGDYPTAIAALRKAHSAGYSEALPLLEQAEAHLIGVEPNKRADVFISWNHLDQDLKNALAGDLKKAGFSVWDSDSYCNGKIPLACQMGIERSSLFLVLVTPNALQSGYIPQEIEWMKARASRSALGLQTVKAIFYGVEEAIAALKVTEGEKNAFVWLHGEEVGTSFLLKKGEAPNEENLFPQLKEALFSARLLSYQENLRKSCGDFAFALSDRTLDHLRKNGQPIKTRVSTSLGYVERRLLLDDDTLYSSDLLEEKRPIFLFGEKGMGKSLFLRSLIHEQSRNDRLYFLLDASTLSSAKDLASLLGLLKKEVERSSFENPEPLNENTFLSLFAHSDEKSFGEIYLWVDGFDRLSGREKKDVAALVKELLIRYPSLHFLLASSEKGDEAYLRSLSSASLSLHLAGLNEKERQLLLHHLLKNAHLEGKADQSGVALEENAILSSLASLDSEIASNPLFLANLAVVYLSTGQLPQSGYLILEETVLIALGELMEAEPNGLVDLRGYTLRKIPEILAFLSFCKTGNPARENEAIVLQFLKERCKASEMGEDYAYFLAEGAKEKEAKCLVDYLSLRSILGVNGLCHQDFGEYFAARFCYGYIYENGSDATGLQGLVFQEKGQEALTQYARLLFDKEEAWSPIVSSLLVKVDQEIYLVSLGMAAPSEGSKATLKTSLAVVYEGTKNSERPSFRHLQELAERKQLHYGEEITRSLADLGKAV